MKARGSRRLFCLPDFESVAHVSAHQKKTRKASLGFMVSICLIAGAFSLFQILSKVFSSRADSTPTITSISPTSGPTAGGTSVTVSGTSFLSGNDSNTKLLLHGDGSGSSFSDSSSSSKTITANGDVTQSTSQSKFGGKSIYFDGSGDYLTVPDSDDWNFGSGDFTIDFWIKTNAITNRTILGQWVDSGNFWRIASDGSDFFLQTSSGGFWVSCANSLVGDDVLHHIAIVRNGTSLTLYLDGIAKSTQTNSNAWPDISTTLNLGYYAGTLSAFSGYIDEFRISKGTARWTSGFTPPVTSYAGPDVAIGGTNATNINFVNSTTITATTPAHAAGTADVTVTNYDGQSATLTSAYTYTAPPTITSITPNSSLKTGGDTVTITGTNFTASGLYRMPITISNSNAASLSDYQTSFVVDTAVLVTAGKMRSDGGDIRITDADGTTPLSYWVEPNTINTTTTKIWVKIPSIPTAGKTVYLCYGNSSLTSQSSSSATFIREIANLKGSWNMDETSGTTVADSSGNNNSGTASSTSIVSGKYGNGLEFATTGNSVTVPTASSLNFSKSAASMDFFLKTTSTSGTKTILHKYNNSSGYGYIIMLSSGKISTVPYYGAYGVSGTISVADGAWHHITFTRNGATVKIYVDGNLDISSSTSVYNSDNTINLQFGHNYGQNGDFVGTLDEVHVFSGELQAAEVSSLASNKGYSTTNYPNKILVKKVASVEPTASVGTEANASSVPIVSFGGTNSSSVTLVNSTTLSVVVPAHNEETVNVTVTNPNGQSATLASGFTFTGPAPTISSVSPTSGSITGGTNVTITGTNFASQNTGGDTGWATVGGTLPGSVYGGAQAVIGDYVYLFGGYNGSSYFNTIYCAPVSDPTNWTNTGKTLPTIFYLGQLAIVGDHVYLFGGYNGSTYNKIYSAPVSDPTSWTDTGKTLPGNLNAGSMVIANNNIYLYGGGNGTNWTNVIYSASTADPTTWTNTGKTLPTTMGWQQSVVIGNNVYLLGGYNGSSYLNTIYSASISDPTTFTNTGKTLPNTFGYSQVAVIGNYAYLFGGYNGSSSLNAIYRTPISDPTSWSAVSGTLSVALRASHVAVVDDYVYLFGGLTTSATSAIYRAPLSHFRPNQYNKSWITNWYTNSNLIDQSNVTFGGTQATNINFVNSSTITATTPAHAAGATDVVVTNYDGQSSTLAGAFTYTAPPTITSITPNSGSKTGGDTVTITGTDFYGTPTVSFGGTNATSVTLQDSNTLSVVVPASNAGIVDVTVTNPNSQSATLASGFTFTEPAPTISSIAPTSGPSTGGTNVTITGSNFIPQNTGGDAGWAVVSGKTLPASMRGSQVAVIGDYVYLFGGYNGSTYLNKIYRAAVSDPATWTDTGKTLPGSLYRSQLAVVGNNIYLFGGYNGSAMTNVIYSASVSDPTTWTNTGKTLPSNLGYSQLAIVGNMMYLLGGATTASSSATNIIYSASTADPTTWSNTGKTLPANLRMSQMSVIGSSLYLFGGYNGSSSVGTIYSASTADPTTWTSTGKSLPSVNNAAQVSVIGDYLYMFGGNNGSASVSTIFKASTSDPTTWTTASGTLAAALHDSQSAVIGGYVYLFGGYTTADTTAIYRAPLSQYRANVSNKPWITSWQTVSSDQSNITIGGQQATNINFVNSSTITASTPAHIAGPTDATVTNYDGQSATLTNGFTYIAPPTITSITPNSSLKTGGDTVTITGADFYGTPTVTFGGTNATSVTLQDSNTLSVVVPTHNAGTVDVVVTNPDSQSATLTSGFTYTELAPTISSITPTSGPAAGGTNVTITGTNFIFGNDSNTVLLLHNDGSGTSFSDSSSNPKTVTANGSATQTATQSKFGDSSANFSTSSDYLALADSTDLNISSGSWTMDCWVYPTGAESGDNIDLFRDGSAVASRWAWDFASSNIRYVSANNTILWTVSATINMNAWNHVAMASDGTTAYMFVNGTLVGTRAAFNPGYFGTPSVARQGSSGVISSSNQYFIDEFRLTKGIARWTSSFTPSTSRYGTTNVTLGGQQATNITATSSTTITATTPAHSVGSADVTVINYDGQSATLTNAFTYIAPPTVTSITPNNPTNNQSASVTVTGQDFQNGATVKFTRAGQTDVTCTNPTFTSQTTLTCDADFHGVEPGAWTVVVINADGQSTSNDGILNIIGEVTQLKFATAPLTIKPDVASSGIRIALADISGREVPSQSDVTIDLSSNSTTGSFSLQRNTWQPITQISINSGESSKAVYYKDATLGTFSLSASENPSSNWTDASQQIVISKNAPYTWPFDEQSDYTYDAQTTDVANSYAQLKDLSGSVDVGTGSDSSVTISANKNINTDTIATSRTCADAINYSVTALTTNTATLSETPAAGCLAAGDEILLINLQGTSSSYANVGNHETLRIQSVSDGTITFTQNKTKYYGDSSNGDTNIGTVTTNQRVVLQRVPNYQNVTIDSGITLTASAWDGTKGGVLYFKASGTVTNNGTIDMSGKGYRGGDSYASSDKGSGQGKQGESYLGLGAGSTVANGGGGGGAHTSGCSAAGGGAASFGSVGTGTTGTSSYVVGAFGNTYGDDARFMFGSGGGGGSHTCGGPAGNGGAGGGAVYVVANVINVGGAVRSQGAAGVSANGDSRGGSGSGGQIILSGENINVGSSSVLATGLSNGSVGGDGRIMVFPSPFGATTGTTNPTAKINKYISNIVPVSNVSSASLSYSELTSFTEDLGTQNQGSIKYQLSNNGGSTWYWWNGSTWASTAQGVAQANDAATINSHAATFHTQTGQVGVGQLSFRAYLTSNGVQKVQLDSINVGYKIYPYKYVFSQVPTTLSETEVGTYVVQGQDQNGNVMTVTQDTILNLATSTSETGKFAIDLLENESTRWDHTSVTIPEGSSSATFYYTDALKGDKTISATSSDTSIAATISQHIKSRYRFLVTGISDPVHAGVASSITVNAVNYNGNPTVDYVGTVHFDSTDLGASLPADFTFTADMLGAHTFTNGVTMTTQGEWNVTTTDVSDSDITGAQTGITVEEPLMGTPSQLNISTPEQYVPVSSASSPITVELRDSTNSPAAKTTDTTVYISHNSSSGQLSLDGETWVSGTLSATIPAGVVSVNVYFKDTTLGDYVISVRDDATEGEDYGLTNASQNVHVSAGPPASFDLAGVPASSEVGAVSLLTVTLKDVAGNTVSTFNDQAAYLTSAFGGEFSENGTDNWTSVYAKTMINGENSFNVYYRNTHASSDTVTVSDTNPANGNTGLADDSAGSLVTSGQITRYALVGTPSGLVVGQASPNITIQAYDQYGNVAVAAGDQTIYLYGTDSNTQFSQSSSPFAAVSSVSMTSGTSTATFSAKQNTNASNITITASDNATAPDGNAGIIDATQTINISAGNVASFKLVSSNSIAVGAGQESQLIRIETRNAYGIKTPLSSDTVIYFQSSSSGTAKEFSLDPSPAWSAITQTTMLAGSDTLTFYYKDTKAGSHTLTIGDDPAATDNGITNAQLTANIQPQSPAALDITSTSFSVEAGALAGPIDVYLKDQYGNTAVAEQDTAVNLTADNLGLSFYDQNGNSVNSLTIPSGATHVSFKVRAYQQQTYNIQVSAGTLTGDSQAFTVVWGDPNTVAFVQNVSQGTAGEIAGPFTVELRNSHGVGVNATSQTTINLSNSRNGAFGADGEATFDGSFNTISIPVGESQASFYYRPVATGTHLLTAQSTGLNYGETSLNVNPANVVSVTFRNGEQTVTKGAVSNVYTLIGLDEFGNEATVGADENITLVSDSADAQFSRTNSPWQSTLVTTISSGQSRAYFYYKDNVSGVHQIQAISQFSTALQNVNVADTPIREAIPDRYLFQGGATPFIIDNEKTFSFYLADGSGYAKANRQITATITTSSTTGQLRQSETDSWSSSIDVVFSAGETMKSFQYHDSVAGNPTITISGGGLTSASQQQIIENGTIEKIALSGASAINTTDRIPVVISLLTNSDLPVRTNENVEINLSNSSAQGRFYETPSGLPTNSTIINDGYCQKTIYFQKTVPGDVSLTASENPERGWTDATKNISVTAQGTHLRFTTDPQSAVAGTESNLMTIRLEDLYHNPVTTAEDIVLHLSSSSSFAKFSQENGSNWSDAEEITLSAGGSTTSFYVKDTAAGTHTLTVSDVSAPAENPDTGIVNATQSFTVAAAEAHSIALLSGATQNLLAGQASAPITVQLRDQYGNARTVQTDTRLYISSTSQNALFSLTNDFSSSHLISSFVVPAGSSVATFYFKDTAVEHVTINISSEDPTLGSGKGIFGILRAFADEVDLIGASAEMDVTMGDPARLIWESLPTQQQAGDEGVSAVLKLTNQYYVEMPAPNNMEVYFSSSSAQGEFSLTQGGPWQTNLPAALNAGESRMTVFYRDTTVGSALLTASDVSAPAENPDTNLSNAAGYVEVVYGSPAQIVFTSASQTIVANHESTQIGIQLLNQFGVPAPASSDTLIYLRSTSSRGSFSEDGLTWGVNGVLIPSGEDHAEFFYRDPLAGTPTITAADSLPLTSDINLVNATQQQTITAQTVDSLHVTNISDPQYQGTPSSLVVRALDADGYVVETYDGTLTDIKVYDDANNEEQAILPPVPYTFQPDTDRGIKTFNNAVAFVSTGEKKVTVQDNQGHSGSQENITVQTPPGGVLTSVEFISPSDTLSIENDKQSELITVQLRNGSDEPWNVTNDEGFKIKVVSSSEDGSFSEDGDNWNEELEVVVPKGLNFASFYYHDTKAGSAELEVSDWQVDTDSASIENDTLNVVIAAGVAATFSLSANPNQVAGESQSLSIIAYDIHGNIATGYTGIKPVILSGASVSPAQNKATCKNSSDDNIELGLATDLEFSAGVATCELTLYMAEQAQIGVTDGIIATTAKQNISVSADVINAQQSVISASPNPQKVNSPIKIYVTPKDRYGNFSLEQARIMTAWIDGSNRIENLALSFNATDNIYETAYSPTASGTDLIKVKLDEAYIQKDTEGTNDGTFHETVEGESTDADRCTKQFVLDSWNSDSFAMKLCIWASEKTESDRIDRSNSGETDIYAITIQADGADDLEGKLGFTSYAQKPDSHELDSSYEDSDKYDVYKYFRVKNDFTSGSANSGKIFFRISKSWIEDNNIQNIKAVKLDSSDALAMSKGGSESADSYVYEFDADDLEGYWAIVGEKGDVSTEVQEVAQNGEGLLTLLPADDGQIQDQVLEEKQSEEKESSKASKIFSSSVDDIFSKIMTTDDPQEVEEAKRIANVVAGTAATAAAIPMLPNVLGLARMLSAMPLNRRKKWGIVYDAGSGEPVAHALVSIIGSDGKVKEVKTTDQNGSYFFNARAGLYTLEAFKAGYESLDNVHSDSFHTFYGQSYDRSDVIDLKEDGILSVNVPLHQEGKTQQKELLTKSVIMHAIFWAGFIVSGFALIVHPGVLNLAVFGVFVANFFINTFVFPTLKGSKIIDINGQAIPFASVKIFDVSDGSLAMRTNTNEKGVFAAILSPGKYELQVDATNKRLRIPIVSRHHRELRKIIKLM